MQRVAIIGAGELGGAIAHVVARRNTCRSLTLVDENGLIAEGKALDIAQAAPVEGFATRVSAGPDTASVAGADVIVIADRANGQAEWQGEDALQLLRRLTSFGGAATIVCAGALQREVVERGVRELKIARTRLFGTAPEALGASVRAIVALALDGSPGDVALLVAGVPPAHVVCSWGDATLAGIALTRLLDEPTRRRLAARASALWPPGPHALAAAAWLALDVMAGRSRRRISAFVGPEEGGGVRTRAAALPVRLGPAGIVDVLVPSLSVSERVALENALLL